MTRNIHSNNKESKDKKILTFAVPGGKVYINDYYTNSPGSFLNISITGQDCQLMCRHCRRELLKGMSEAGDSKKLVELVKKYIKRARNNRENTGNGPLKGMLISGGFDAEGKLPVNNILSGISELKSKYPFLTIYIHTGFLDEDEAAALKRSGVDAVLVNLIGSQKAIREVYNLRDRTYNDYLDTIKLLKVHGLKVSPHIIIGLEDGKLSDEFRTVKDALALGVDSLVFIVLKKASRTADFISSKVPHDEIIGLVKYARELSPDVLLSFGCAKPPDSSRHLLEIELIKAGIDSMAFPAEETVRFAVENKIAHTFVEKCCAIL
ncbi:MAG: radical SAM protein [Actinobacteria bacterium]|nr:radical SAM protein [Actinomycetota bacterium]